MSNPLQRYDALAGWRVSQPPAAATSEPPFCARIRPAGKNKKSQPARPGWLKENSKRGRRYIEQLPDTIENAVTAMLG
jgi:hypothetical protein